MLDLSILCSYLANYMRAVKIEYQNDFVNFYKLPDGITHKETGINWLKGGKAMLRGPTRLHKDRSKNG